MKKFILCVTALIIAITFISIKKPTETGYLRIHIRANSNEQTDQNVKYIVKDKVVEYLTPIVSECKTFSKAKEKMSSCLSEIEDVADNVLKQQGFGYTSKAKINNEKFPTRAYGDLTLNEGYYDALIIELGSGEGNNWWCVVYPPLCFVGSGTEYIYKSKIKEIIDNFYKNRREYVN